MAVPDPIPAPPHALLAAAFEHAGACVAVLTGDALRFEVANAACRSFAPDGDIVGRTFDAVFPQAAAAGVAGQLRRVLDTGERWVIDRERVPMPALPDAVWDGDAVRLPSADGGEPSLVIVVRSATERVRGEQLLSRQRQLALDAARLGWWHYDPASGLTTFDERFKSIFGVSGATISGQAFADRVHADDLPMLLDALRAALDPADPRPYVAHFRIGSDGEMRWIESHGVAAFDGDGAARRAVSMSGTLADVTDRHQAELALRRSEATLNAVLDALPAGVVITDAQGRVVRHNAATRDLWGLPPETRSWEGYGDWKGWWPDTGRRIEAGEWAMTRALLHGEVTRGQLVMNQPFGSDERRYFLNNVAPLVDADGAIVGAVAAMLDVTDRLAAEQQMRESEWRLRVAAEGAELGVFDWKVVGDEARWENDRIYAIFGRSREQGPLSLAEFTSDVLHPDDRDTFVRQMDAARQSGATMRVSFRIRRCDDGELRWLECSGQFDRHADTSSSRFVGVIADISDRKRVEATMRSTRDTLRRLVDSSPFGVYVVDADCRMAQASVGARRLYGVVQPLMGRDIGEVMRQVWCDADADEIVSRFARTLDSGEPHHAPNAVLQRRDGGATEFHDWRIERILLPDGRHGVVCHFYDLSERQRYEAALRESEERFRQLADAMPQLVWTADSNGRVNYFNSRAADYRGITAHDDGTFSWTSLIHPADIDRTMATWRRAVASGAGYEIEYRMQMADGSYRWHLGRAHGAGSDGTGERWFGTSTDIHQLKIAEEALREGDRRKDDFLAILAHELRNPLAPIRTGVQILRMTPGLADSKALPMMERQVRHMSRLLDDLLDVGRITRGVIELRRELVELASLVNAAADACRPLLEQMRHRLVVSLPATPVTMDADPVRITQVFSNLINNAAKYMDAGGCIEVRAAVDGGEVVVSVLDHGVGIEPENLDAIFEMFVQVGTALSRSQGGLGVGLSLVRGLVTLHGGSVQARSAGAGCGAEFVVRLPVLQSPAAVDGGDEAGSAPVRLKILVVDDNRDAANSMALLLELMDHEVRAAFGGSAALAAATEFGPQLALVDLGMPGMDGYEVCRRLRQLPRGESMVIVAVTGWGQDDDRRRTQAAGFDGHLVKPVDPDALLKLIGELPLRRPDPAQAVQP